MERNYFCLSEFSSNILSIHEQFSLLLQEKTIVIAEGLGMKHQLNGNLGSVDALID
ncbi:hypothetical protein [Bacillus toyonensis]|uniref:hypothetical protein n=1 Tax=Bacillus toyonensis TaxID=155322 RepID=UPI001594D377|nr:hypothetical protein [Bacillus toyonensis]MBX0355982.1 hypothetical protein [Bacillus toyonensis]MDM5254318.1 hypothetical protein [Bacillus toyonensis]MEC2393383.1 hypothetical protein [Bacillus toyonensis]